MGGGGVLGVTGPDSARVDALIAAVAPDLAASAAPHREVVLVTGPPLAGVGAVVAALRDRLPDRTFTEAPHPAPAAVVFVVSAAAALTESDCLLLDSAVARTDVVIGVLAKIDVHRQWPQLLDLARQTVAARSPRYRAMPWVGVAAAPRQGGPGVADLVTELRRQLGDGTAARRNRLREWESRLCAAAAAEDRAAATLQARRDAAVRARRLSAAQRSIALRSRIARARVRLHYLARSRCSALRAELAEEVAGMTRRRLPGFEAHARHRADEILAEVGRAAAAQLAEVAGGPGLVPDRPPGAPLPKVEVSPIAWRSRRLETQLMVLLGAGFGLGVALTLSRLCSGVAAGPGAAVSAVAGLVAAAWVVGVRGLLRDRAVLERWLADVVAALRAATEELVAMRVLSAESALTAALAEQDGVEGGAAAARIAALNGAVRAHPTAAALRDRRLPPLRHALAAVRAELGVG